MTREQAKKLLPVIQAFAEGKIIQCKTHNETEWSDIEKASFNTNLCDYRIKPEEKYRPFKSKEECWQEMIKHQPFGWITDGFYKTTISVKSNSIVLTISSDEYVYPDAFHTFKFTDGTPFGIKED